MLMRALRKVEPLATLILLLLNATGVAAESKPAVDMKEFAARSAVWLPGTIGWEFEILSSVVVTRLGIFDASSGGPNHDVPVCVWNNDGSEVARALVPRGQLGESDRQFRHVPIDRVSLSPGRYVIGAFYPVGSNMSTAFAAPRTVACAKGLRLLKGRWIAGDTIDFPRGGVVRVPDCPMQFGPMFFVENSVTQESTRQPAGAAAELVPRAAGDPVAIASQPFESRRTNHVSLSCDQGGVREVSHSSMSKAARNYFTVSLERAVAADEPPIAISLTVDKDAADAAHESRYVINTPLSIVFKPGGPASQRVDVQSVNDNLVNGIKFVRLRIEPPAAGASWAVGIAEAAMPVHDNDFWRWGPLGGDGPANRATSKTPAYTYTREVDARAICFFDTFTFTAHARSSLIRHDRSVWRWRDSVVDAHAVGQVELRLHADGLITAHHSGFTAVTNEETAAAVGVEVSINNTSLMRRTAKLRFSSKAAMHCNYEIVPPSVFVREEPTGRSLAEEWRTFHKLIQVTEKPVPHPDMRHVTHDFTFTIEAICSERDDTPP